MIVDKPITHSETALIVNRLRRENPAVGNALDKEYFYRMTILEVINELKLKNVKVSERWVLEASRRLVSVGG